MTKLQEKKGAKGGWPWSVAPMQPSTMHEYLHGPMMKGLTCDDGIQQIYRNSNRII